MARSKIDGSRQLKDDSVGGSQITDDSVESKDIKDGSLGLVDTASSFIKKNATAAPTVNNDSSTGEGYSPGSIWIDVTNDKAYVCLDSTEGAAVWTEITGGGGATKYTATVKASGGDHDWGGSAGAYTVTISAATHGVGQDPDYEVTIECFQLNGSDYDKIQPSVARAESDGDVYIEMPTNDDLYVYIHG